MKVAQGQIKAGTILSYLQMALSIVIGLVYMPIMANILGEREYGLYNTVASIISILSILSLGFNSSYIRFYARYKKNNDDKAIAKLNGLFLILFVVIGLVALFCGLYLSYDIKLVMGGELTAGEYEIAKKLMALLAINLAVSFPASVFTNIISAHERFVFLKIAGMIKTVLGPFVTLPILLMGYGSVGMVVVSTLFSVFTDLLYVVFVFGKLKQKFRFSNFEKGLFREMCGYTLFIAINMIIDQINWNLSKIVLVQYKGPSMVSIYSVGYALYSYYMMFSNSISSLFVPRVHKIVNDTKDDEVKARFELTDLFTKVGRIQYIILGLIASGIVFFGYLFIVNYWMKNEFYGPSYWVALLLIISSTIAMIQNVGIEIQRAENKHKFRSIVYAFMAVLNLIVSIFLCQIYGAIGSAIGTAVSLIVANGIIMNVYYHKKCNINIVHFWKEILKLSMGLIIPIAVGWAITTFIPANNVLIFLLEIVVYSLVYCLSMWLIGMNKYEKGLVKGMINKLIRRRNNASN